MAFDREDSLKKAEKLLRQGRLDAAIAEYQLVVEGQPRDWNTANTLGDLYAVLTFSGKGRSNVRMRTIKAFDETNGAVVRRRIAALEPEGYTRAGAAIRHAAALLERQPAAHRLLLIISDGKPNDVDGYEGLNGVEDTRQAINESLRDLPIVGDVRGAGFFQAIELVKDKETRESFDDDESERLLRGFLSGALFKQGLICRADDRGDPVIQLSPPLIADTEQFEEIEAILRKVLAEAWEKI